MTTKQDDQEGKPISERTSFSAVVVGSLLTAAIACVAAFYSIKADTAELKGIATKLDHDKVSRWELARWSRALQRDNLGNLKVEVYVPEEGNDK